MKDDADRLENVLAERGMARLHAPSHAEPEPETPPEAERSPDWDEFRLKLPRGYRAELTAYAMKRNLRLSDLILRALDQHEPLQRAGVRPRAADLGKGARRKRRSGASGSTG